MPKSNKTQWGGFAAFLIIVAVIIAFASGWCMNVYKIVTGLDVMTTTEAIIRCVGVLAAPLGAVAGYF